MRSITRVFASSWLVLLLGCSNNEPSQAPDNDSELTTQNITVDNRARTFLLYKPKGYNNAGKMPVLLVNHGGQSTSQGMMAVADFRSLADTEKFLLIYPRAIKTHGTTADRPRRTRQASMTSTTSGNYATTL